MAEKRSNHAVYNVNYHFMYCPKYRHAILGPVEDSLEASFRYLFEQHQFRF
jgi:putative transposase